MGHAELNSDARRIVISEFMERDGGRRARESRFDVHYDKRLVDRRGNSSLRGSPMPMR